MSPFTRFTRICSTSPRQQTLKKGHLYGQLNLVKNRQTYFTGSESGWEHSEELEVRIAKSALFKEHSLGAGMEAAFASQFMNGAKYRLAE